MIVLLIALLVFVVVAALAYWLAGKSRCGQYPKCGCGPAEDCEVEHFGNPLADDLRGVGGGESLHARKPKEFLPLNTVTPASMDDFGASSVFATAAYWSSVIDAQERIQIESESRRSSSPVVNTLDDTPPYVPADRERQAIAEVESIEPSRLDVSHHADSYHDHGSSYHHDSSSSHFDSGSGFSSSDF